MLTTGDVLVAWEWNGSGMVRVAMGMMVVAVMSERVVGGASDIYVDRAKLLRGTCSLQQVGGFYGICHFQLRRRLRSAGWDPHVPRVHG